MFYDYRYKYIYILYNFFVSTSGCVWFVCVYESWILVFYIFSSTLSYARTLNLDSNPVNTMSTANTIRVWKLNADRNDAKYVIKSSGYRVV